MRTNCLAADVINANGSAAMECEKAKDAQNGSLFGGFGLNTLCLKFVVPGSFLMYLK